MAPKLGAELIWNLKKQFIVSKQFNVRKLQSSSIKLLSEAKKFISESKKPSLID